MNEVTCGWLVAQYRHEGPCKYDEQYDECIHCAPYEDGPQHVECGATVTDLPNGWECAAGHGHVGDAEYYDDDEIVAAVESGRSLPANARRMDGSAV